MVQMSLYRYCRAADGVLDPKGPLATRADRRLQLHHPIIIGAAPRVGRCTVQSRKLKPRKLILSAYVDFSRKLEPPKITRHTVGVSKNYSGTWGGVLIGFNVQN